MKWPSMFVWLFVCVCGLSVAPSVAKVAHVSINLRMFDVGKLPLLKINIVSNITDTNRFQFIMHQTSGDERLMVSRVNDFMLLVQGVEEVTDRQAVLQVKEYRDNYWMDVATLALFSDSVPVGSPPDNKKFALYKQQATVPLHNGSASNLAKVTAVVQPVAKVVKPVTASVTAATSAPAASNIAVAQSQPVAKVVEPVTASVTAATSAPTASNIAVASPAPVLLATLAPATSATADAPVTMPMATLAANTSGDSAIVAGCTIDYNGEQTLWRLATRYSKEWQTNVYAAALGIFESNPKAFAKGKPSGLRRDAVLRCPSMDALVQYADKSTAEKKFDSLL
ncbi:hypothetical protein L9G74_06250 [Shewanella sp. C32]|uniref:Tfp pilus assembly protein FimV n=1 Tax=Shewanella electrica TaxID=515560 RepID=A0ABT2FK30_9GAMM|nr:hypothetical protein [Shewanella electrica]MCH1924132.1 hypothetical protein [Shewanella electrica]MCS4556035.1 hypothetical protein [Shewanella electrica]